MKVEDIANPAKSVETEAITTAVGWQTLSFDFGNASSGTPVLNLDTHILVHALSGAITARERALLSSESWSISAIVLWELAKLAQLGRIEVDLEDAE